MSNTTALPARTFRVEREGRNGVTVLFGEHTNVDDAADAAAQAWLQEDNGFLGFPVFRVIDETGATCVDPIDCRP